MVSFLCVLEGAARYAGLLLAPAEGFGLQTEQIIFFFMIFWDIFGQFWVFCPKGKKRPRPKPSSGARRRPA